MDPSTKARHLYPQLLSYLYRACCPNRETRGGCFSESWSEQRTIDLSRKRIDVPSLPEASARILRVFQAVGGPLQWHNREGVLSLSASRRALPHGRATVEFVPEFKISDLSNSAYTSRCACDSVGSVFYGTSYHLTEAQLLRERLRTQIQSRSARQGRGSIARGDNPGRCKVPWTRGALQGRKRKRFLGGLSVALTGRDSTMLLEELGLQF